MSSLDMALSLFIMSSVTVAVGLAIFISVYTQHNITNLLSK